MKGARRVVVVTTDPIADAMAGPAIRAWHLAEVLVRDGHEVRLLSTARADASSPSFEIYLADAATLAAAEDWCDVVVFQGGLLRLFPTLLDSEKPLVADVYAPFHLENLEGAGTAADERHGVIEHLVSVVDEQLRRADFFLCASERQRDYWLGALSALGRLNPATYDEDPTLRSLIDVVPFGVDPDPPGAGEPVIRGVVDGIGPDDHLLLWAGGVYNWFDPLTLVRAVDRLRDEIPQLRLYFLGMGHPNPAIPAMAMATRLRALSDELGLTGRFVFFNDGWVPYADRGRYLREADVGISTHADHIETAFSFRTRMLDYLWAGLPMISTDGDHFADVIRSAGLGVVVPPADDEALAAAIRALVLDDERRRAAAAASAALAALSTWDRVSRPLVEFCRSPRVAPDRARRLGHLRASLGAPAVADRRSVVRRILGRVRSGR